MHHAWWPQSLSGCAQLEDAPLEAALSRSPCLIKLSINGCARLVSPKLSSASLQYLRCEGVAAEVTAPPEP